MPNTDQPAGIAADTCFETDDIDAMQAQAASDHWDIRYTQLENGGFNARYEAWEFSDLSVLRERYGRKAYIAGSAPTSQFSFFVPNTDSGRFHCNSEPVQSGSLFAVRPGQDIDFTTFAAVDATSIQIDRSFFERIAQALFGEPGDRGLEYGRALLLDASLFASLSELLPKPSSDGDLLPIWSDGATAKSYFVSVLTERLVSAIARGPNRTNSPHTNAGERSYRVARRARDFIEANMQRMIARSELCEVTGATLRTLHDNFLNCYGVAPITYHRFRRLKLAHDRLRNGRPAQNSVSRVALGLGFSHFGRFAGHYKAVFGESPSDTLANPHP